MREISYLCLVIDILLMTCDCNGVFAQVKLQKKSQQDSLSIEIRCRQFDSLCDCKNEVILSKYYKTDVITFSSYNHKLINKISTELSNNFNYSEIVALSDKYNSDPEFELEIIGDVLAYQIEDKDDKNIFFAGRDKWQRVILPQKIIKRNKNLFYIHLNLGAYGHLHGDFKSYLKFIYIKDTLLLDDNQSKSCYENFLYVQKIKYHKSFIDLITQHNDTLIIDSMKHIYNNEFFAYVLLSLPFYLNHSESFFSLVEYCKNNIENLLLQLSLLDVSDRQRLRFLIYLYNSKYNKYFEEKLFQILISKEQDALKIIKYYYIYLSYISLDKASKISKIIFLKDNIARFNPNLITLIHQLR